LRAGRISSGMREHGIVILHLRVLGDFHQSRQRSDTQTLCAISYPVQVADALYIHQALGMDDVVFHQPQQVAPACQNLGVVPLFTKQCDCLLFLFWDGVFEGSHALAPSDSAFSSASSTRSGVSGRKGTRTPMALATAFEIAAPGETVGGSPMPIT